MIHVWNDDIDCECKRIFERHVESGDYDPDRLPTYCVCMGRPNDERCHCEFCTFDREMVAHYMACAARMPLGTVN